MPDLVGSAKVDRIAVLVSCGGTSKFLGAPKIETSTGENIAQAVYDTLLKWKIVELVEGMSFDTTSSNTGIENGAAALLEKKLVANY